MTGPKKFYYNLEHLTKAQSCFGIKHLHCIARRHQGCHKFFMFRSHFTDAYLFVNNHITLGPSFLFINKTKRATNQCHKTGVYMISGLSKVEFVLNDKIVHQGREGDMVGI